MIQLIPMVEEDFQAYLEKAIIEYGEEQARAGNWHPSEAQERSEKEYQHYLPNGLATENNTLYTIFDETCSEKLGMIWMAVFVDRAVPMSFIFDFHIYEAHRRKGYATQALAAIEEKAAGLGAGSIGLHVFAHNRAARALYEKAGYQINSVNMIKKL